MALDRRIRTSLVSIGADLVLVVGKGMLSWLTGSLALAADALHSLSDLAVSSLVLVGLLVCRRRERQGKDPKGSRRLQGAISYAVALLILYASYEIAVTLVRRPPQPLQHLGPAVVGLIAFIALAYFISRLKLMVGRETDSPALEADGYHSRMDMLSSIAVLLAVMGDAIGIRLDPIVAGVIALLIGVTGVELLVSSFRTLWGGEVPSDSWLFGRFGRWAGAALERSRARGLARSVQRSGRARAWTAGASASGAALVWMLSGFTVVAPDEVGVLTRFGAVREAALAPGLHYRLPWPVERIEKARPKRAERLEIGFRSVERSAASVESQSWHSLHGGGLVKVKNEGLMLCGDESLVDVNLVVHYRARDAAALLFRAESPAEMVRGLAEGIAREELATFPVDRVLSGDRRDVLVRLEQRLREECSRIGLGVEILAVLLQDAHPPLEVVPSFRDVFSAREDQLKLLELAESHRNQALPAARAESQTRLAEAAAYEAEKRLHAEGDAERFLLSSDAWRASPGVTRYRLFLETAEIGLAGKKKIIANPRANRGGYHLWLFSPDRPPTSTEARPPTPKAP